ncbi:Ger(x)C family spore germination protein [Paenibacillus sp. HGF5]|uniref:Ger(x)C family spore germination protein n=1 Tax=Paenibacillus sp. HGF5 TaxID=908341 RepID=UPI0002073097|nr:Ger(x)C family spore germination protein [Paenibacillus sp. HGF5]EGG34648.1 germination protein, Ger(x)C family [Paenibacillus sp. HGF5]
MNNLANIRLALKCLMLAALVPLLAGCWDNKDINHRSLPVIMGISLTEDNQYKVFLDIPATNDTSTVNIVSDTGNTINEIIDHMSMNMETQVDLLHLKIVIVDKNFARNGMEDIISAFNRSRDISSKTLFAISDQTLDQFFMEMQKKSEHSSSIVYDFFEKNAGWNPQLADTRVWQLFRSIHSYTHDVIVPIIRSGRSTSIECLGSAIIKNGRMTGQIGPDETLVANAFYGKSAFGKVEVMESATVQIISNRLTHHSWMKDGKPYLRSHLKLKVTILDSRGHPTEEQINEKVEELLTLRLNQMFKKTQKEQADILALGQYFRNYLTREQLEDWRTTYYPDLDFKLNVTTVVENRGNLKRL